MQLFDVTQYELPKMSEVDWLQTKYNVGVFLIAYKRSRERIGLSAVPQLNQQVRIKEVEIGLQKKVSLGDQKEFNYMQKCFCYGFYAIVHPYRPEVTERRRKIFIYRYFHGLSISLVSERINYQKNIIVDDSKMAMIQFATSLNLISILN